MLSNQSTNHSSRSERLSGSRRPMNWQDGSVELQNQSLGFFNDFGIGIIEFRRNLECETRTVSKKEIARRAILTGTVHIMIGNPSGETEERICPGRSNPQSCEQRSTSDALPPSRSAF